MLRNLYMQNPFSVDKYLNKSFSYKNYNCYHFVRDIWLELTGVDLGDQVPKDPGTEAYNQKALQVANTLTELPSPQDPSIVLFRRARLEPHIGVYLNGKVLHLTRHGAYYMALGQVSAGYPKVTYYK